MGASTPLEFVNEAISLSGVTGTKLKCEVVGKYYPFWWKITSGGKGLNYTKATAIVELYAATGEDYIKELGETILGSSGHALELKVNHLNDNTLDTSKLKVVLIEKDPKCYELLKKVIQRRWPSVSITEAEGPIEFNFSNIYLLNKGLEEAITIIEYMRLGNAIYYFDPLRSVEWKAIEDVARKRITDFCQTGTEFLIFLFTSDWFLGRDALAPLPVTTDQSKWSKPQETTVLEADALFGDQMWRKYILKTETIETKQKTFVNFYRFRLHKWFRYVLPLPFAPKEKQLFHLILCSNYEQGVKVAKDFYDSMTGNPIYLPGTAPSQQAYACFKKNHPELFLNVGRKRPLEWRVLWKTIKYHEEGICDYLCRDFQDIEPRSDRIELAIKWLYEKNYLKIFPVLSAWGHKVERYWLNWETIKKALNIDPPPELKPVSTDEFELLQWQKLFDLIETRRGEQ